MLRFMSFVFLVSAQTSNAWAAEFVFWSYVDENGQKNVIKIYDDVNVSGEEMFIWVRPDGYTVATQPSITAKKVEANVFLQAISGDTLVDANMGLSFGESYEQSKLLLKDPAFRQGFQYLPKSCNDNEQGFLMLSDNITANMFGYCLKLVK